jgi:hypothetical protein
VRAKYQGVYYDAKIVEQLADGRYNVDFYTTDEYWDCATRKEDIVCTRPLGDVRHVHG